MTLWDEKAARVQQGVRSDELDNAIPHSDIEVRHAVMCAREDMVLLVSHISSINGQLSAIRGLLLVNALAVIVIGAAILYRMYH